MLRSVLILFLLVLAGGVLYWQTISEDDANKSQKLFDDFSLEQLNQVDNIVLSRGEDEQLKIVRMDGRWAVPGYLAGIDHPADKNKVFTVLYALHEAKLVEQKTSNPALYQRLGVQDPVGPKPGNVLLNMQTSGGGEWKLIVGNKSKEMARGQYVRKFGDSESWLINRHLPLPEDRKQWLDKRIIDIPPEEIQQIVVTNPRSTENRPVVLMRKEKGEDFIIEGNEEPSESQGMPNGVASAIENLEFKDVYVRSEAYAPPTNETIRAVYTLYEGWDVIVDCYKAMASENTFFQVEARAGEGATTAVIDKVDRLNAKSSHWAYQVPEFLFDNLDVIIEEIK